MISKFTYDCTNVAYSLDKLITISVKDTLLILGLIFYLLYLDWTLTLITFLMIPPIVFVVKYFNKRLRKTSLQIQKMMSNVTQSINETANCNKVIKIYDGFNIEKNKFSKNNKDLRFWQMKQSVAAAANVPSVQFFVALVCSIIIYYVTVSAQNDFTTVGGFISYIAAMLMLSSPVKRLTSIAEHYQKVIAGSKSVFDFMDTSIESNTNYNKERNKDFTGKISLENILYSYPNSNENALKNISLKINPGEKVAIVGSSGSGKTTLANLLTKFIVSSEGKVYFDDFNIEKLPIKELRKNISFVSQHIDLFNDSILNNIAYGELSTKKKEDVIKACEFAYADNFIKNLPDGLNTIIGEKGSRLSGGQRQRIAIARAILKDAPIIIFDEATAALDSESEKFIQLAIENISKKKTCLIIAHRLSTIKKVDKIIVLENGSIVEAGTHDELISQNKQYANFIKIQNI
jgi:subfamily B ATP-binding cassette protein MsbA